ncbi:MAG TPA: hypothetical protein VD994_08435 [Prosthecobacter sp.]|nr:hypothetical protein [Prosthecobacter sp.]
MDHKLHLAALAATALLLSHCTTAYDRASPAPPPAAAGTSRYHSEVAERPGLGTQLGQEIHRNVADTTKFYRKAATTPDAVATFHYNDAEGAKLMAEMSGHAVRRSGTFDLVPGKLRVALASYYGDDPYDHYWSGGKAFVIGQPGQAYEIKLENLTKARMEVVVSIDGLDVLDGQAASIRKRGYVIPAKTTVLIEGMRVGGKLKNLLFATVARSRAATAFGESGARNVGVIGVACYEEDEAARRRARVEETYVRGDARAFGQ